MDKNKNIIFFDGECHLCNGFVDFLISYDVDRKLYFAPLQGVTAQLYLKNEFVSKPDDFKTIMFHTNGRILKKSIALFAIANTLGWPFKLLLVFNLLPTSLCDKVYDFIAKNRYRWFGQRHFCRRATESEKSYLLD